MKCIMKSLVIFHFLFNDIIEEKEFGSTGGEAMTMG